MNCQQALTSPQVLQMLQKDFGLSVSDLQTMASTCGKYQDDPMNLIQCITQFGNQTFKNLISKSLQDCQSAGSEAKCVQAFISNLQQVDPALANIVISCMNFEDINSPLYPILAPFLPIKHNSGFYPLIYPIRRRRTGQIVMIVLLVIFIIIAFLGLGYIMAKK